MPLPASLPNRGRIAYFEPELFGHAFPQGVDLHGGFTVTIT